MAEDWEIWNAILDRVSAGGLDTLPALHQTVYRVHCYLCDVENGGLSGLLYNLSPPAGTPQHDWSFLRLTTAALREVGYATAAATLLRCAERLETVPSGVERPWRELLELALTAAEQDRIHTDLLDNANIGWSLLETFTDRHRRALEQS